MKKFTALALLMILSIPLGAGEPGSEEHRVLKAIADNVFRSFIFSLHQQNFLDAYRLHSETFRAANPYDDWSSFEQEFYALSRGRVRYTNVLTTWYETDAKSERPGTYVNIQYSCQADTLSECSGLMVLHSTDNKNFYIESHNRKYQLISVPESN